MTIVTGRSARDEKGFYKCEFVETGNKSLVQDFQAQGAELD